MKQYTIVTRTIISGNTPEEALEKFSKIPTFTNKNNIEIVEGANVQFELKEKK
tara:strand:- start:28 stop:186 length:159 start_codon:yes stop_codon:yes gene_type:complete